MIFPTLSQVALLTLISVSLLFKLAQANEIYSGEISLGLNHINLNNKNSLYGQYLGIDDDQAYLTADADLFWFNKNGHRAELAGKQLSSNARILEFHSGQTHRYQFSYFHRAIPQLVSSTAQTPYINAGSQHLALPDDFVQSDTTPGMTTLDQNLQRLTLDSERQAHQLQLRYSLSKQWQSNISYHRETKKGLQSLGGTLGEHGGFTDSVILPVPVDYNEERISADLQYFKRNIQFELSYRYAEFTNQYGSMSWDVPFLRAAPVAQTYPNTAEFALPPDNQHQGFTVSGGWNLNSRSRVSLTAEYNQMKQNEALLPYSINSNLITSALPRSHAEAQLNSRRLNLNYTTIPIKNAWLALKYRYYATDNKTPRALFLPVTNDTEAQPGQAAHEASYSRPYDYSKQTFSLDSRYRLTRKTSLKLGYENEHIKRSYRAAKSVEEQRYYTHVNHQTHANLTTSLYYKYIKSTPKSYDDSIGFDAKHTEEYLETVNEDVRFGNHPDNRRFDIAEHNEQRYGGSVTVFPYDTFDISLYGDIYDKTYNRSQLGIQDSKDLVLGLDASFSPIRHVALQFYYNREHIDLKQTGRAYFGADAKASQAFDPNRNWWADHQDRIDTIGLSTQLSLLDEHLELALSYIYARSKTDIHFNAGSELEESKGINAIYDQRHTLSLDGDYVINEQFNIRFGAEYERYRSSDALTRNIDAGGDAIDDVLPLSSPEPDYHALRIYTSLSYRW